MDIYHIWCDLRPGVNDLEFIDAATVYLDTLVKNGQLRTYRITRRKLGLGGPTDFHLMLEFDNLLQLDEAFRTVAVRTDPVESFHQAVNAKVINVSFALYRDFPDTFRERGGEAF